MRCHSAMAHHAASWDRAIRHSHPLLLYYHGTLHSKKRFGPGRLLTSLVDKSHRHYTYYRNSLVNFHLTVRPSPRPRGEKCCLAKIKGARRGERRYVPGYGCIGAISVTPTEAAAVIACRSALPSEGCMICIGLLQMAWAQGMCERRSALQNGIRVRVWATAERLHILFLLTGPRDAFRSSAFALCASIRCASILWVCKSVRECV